MCGVMVYHTPDILKHCCMHYQLLYNLGLTSATVHTCSNSVSFCYKFSEIPVEARHALPSSVVDICVRSLYFHSFLFLFLLIYVYREILRIIDICIARVL